MTDVMKIIRKERKKQGISQEKLAYLVQVDKVSICFWENYKFSPKFEIVENMLNALGLEIVIRKKGETDE